LTYPHRFRRSEGNYFSSLELPMSVLRSLAAASLLMLAGCQTAGPMRQANSWNDTEANCVAVGKLSPAECKCVNGYLAAHISYEKFSRQQAEIINKPVDDWIVIDDKNKKKSISDFMKESPVENIRLFGEAMSLCMPDGKR
jgi:hypothetical protein